MSRKSTHPKQQEEIIRKYGTREPNDFLPLSEERSSTRNIINDREDAIYTT